MGMPTTDYAGPAEPVSRRERLWSLALVLLVFAMVVTAVTGFAYVGDQQRALSALRQEGNTLRAAQASLQRTDALAAHAAGGEAAMVADFARTAEALRQQRATLDAVAASPARLDALLLAWTQAATLGADGHADAAGRLLREAGVGGSVAALDRLVGAQIGELDRQFAEHDGNVALGTLAALTLEVLSGSLAIAGMFMAFRASGRDAAGRLAALRSADTSRAQVARLFEMADVLQSATDYGDANQVLTATASELLPGLSGALYVFNNSRDRLVLSTWWGRDDAPAEIISPDQCWALKRGKPHLNRPDGPKLCCAHHQHSRDTVLEIPMVARGEIMGLFQLFAAGSDAEARLAAVTELGSALADGMSLALANMNLHERLRNQALRDPLTGLYNRRYMEDCLQRFVRLAEREHRDVSVVMVDLDHFKRLNDEHGHAFGDAVLRDTALCIVGTLRETDIVCRYGGEELVVILPDCSLAAAVDKAEALRVRVEALSQTHGAAISASFGVAAVPQTSAGVTDMLAAADAALYRAKQAGRNCVDSAPERPFQLERLPAGAELPLQAAE